MTHDDLTNLLHSIRDGSAAPDEVSRARALAAGDDRLPDEIKPGLLDDDPVADAAGLLALLDADDAFAESLRAAVAEEAGTTEVVLDDAWSETGPAIAAAVRDAAGDVPDLWAAVAADLDVDAGFDIAAAVMDEAGDIDIAGDVMRAVRRGAVAPAAAPPAAANTRRWLIPALAMAAAALLAVLFGPSALRDDRVDLHFASNSEVSVDELDYGPDTMVQLYQPEGDAPLIIWIEDEEAT